MKIKRKGVSSWYVMLLLSVIVYSCAKDDIKAPQLIAYSEVQFNLSSPKGSGGRTNNDASDIASILITIKNGNGTSVYTQEQLDVYEFSGEFISEPISLNVDDYQLIEFYALDGEGSIIFASPLEGSELAHLVDDPLAIDFEVTEDNVTKVTPGLVSTANASAADFGYAAFGFDIVQYFEIQLAVMAYSEEDDNYVLVKSELNVEGDGDVISEKSLDAVTEEIKIKDGYNEYTLSISSNGYEDLTYTFSADSLKGYEGNDPLIVLLDGEGSVEYTGKLIGITRYDNEGSFFGTIDYEGNFTELVQVSDKWVFPSDYSKELGYYSFANYGDSGVEIIDSDGNTILSGSTAIHQLAFWEDENTSIGNYTGVGDSSSIIYKADFDGSIEVIDTINLGFVSWPEYGWSEIDNSNEYYIYSLPSRTTIGGVTRFPRYLIIYDLFNGTHSALDITDIFDSESQLVLHGDLIYGYGHSGSPDEYDLVAMDFDGNKTVINSYSQDLSSDILVENLQFDEKDELFVSVGDYHINIFDLNGELLEQVPLNIDYRNTIYYSFRTMQ